MLSMKAKYAIKALIVMGRNEGKMLQIKTIAKEAEAPQKFLEAILVDLKNHDIVSSKRGIFGGYYLAKPAKKIIMGDIVRIMDGPLAPIRCASLTAYQKCDDCVSEKNCAIRKTMFEVRNAISGVLDNKTLADMISQ